MVISSGRMVSIVLMNALILRMLITRTLINVNVMKIKSQTQMILLHVCKDEIALMSTIPCLILMLAHVYVKVVLAHI